MIGNSDGIYRIGLENPTPDKSIDEKIELTGGGVATTETYKKMVKTRRCYFILSAGCRLGFRRGSGGEGRRTFYQNAHSCRELADFTLY